MSELLSRLAAALHRHTGIATSEAQRSGLAAALRRAAPGGDAEQLVAAIETEGPGSATVARLIDEVTVQETYFHRAPGELAAIPWRRLHDAATARGRSVLDVWVSACATGDEAYTLAILAYEAFGGPPPVRILATDISGAALAQAAAARYSERAISKLPGNLLDRYLIPAGHRYVVSDRIKAMVELARHNLISDPVPGAGAGSFDVVACRNVLIYFDAATSARVQAKLRAALAPGGHLMLGAADALSTVEATLRTRTVPATVRRPRPLRPVRPAAARPAPRTPPPAPAAPSFIATALSAADAGDLDATVAMTERILADAPLDAEARFVKGMAELGRDRPAAAVEAFRAALFLQPSFGLAAFQLGRAHDQLGDAVAAQRAYRQALTALEAGDERDHAALLGQVTPADVADACRARLLSGHPR